MSSAAASTDRAELWLSTSERRLRDRLRALLPPGERIDLALVVSTGVRPGLEAMVPLAAVMFGLLSAVLTVLGMIGLTRARQYFTLAVTERQVALFANQKWWTQRPQHLVATYEGLGAVHGIQEDGDTWVDLDGRRFWVQGLWAGQLYGLGRRLRTHAQPGVVGSSKTSGQDDPDG